MAVGYARCIEAGLTEFCLTCPLTPQTKRAKRDDKMFVFVQTQCVLVW